MASERACQAVDAGNRGGIFAIAPGGMLRIPEYFEFRSTSDSGVLGGQEGTRLEKRGGASCPGGNADRLGLDDLA